jgi:hypothetical protein
MEFVGGRCWEAGRTYEYGHWVHYREQGGGVTPWLCESVLQEYRIHFGIIVKSSYISIYSVIILHYS